MKVKKSITRRTVGVYFGLVLSHGKLFLFIRNAPPKKSIFLISFKKQKTTEFLVTYAGDFFEKP